MSNGNTTHLVTSGLSVGYASKNGEHCLFRDLNLHLPAGRMICFMGPNGAGKSTLIRTLAGLQKPLSGKISVNAGGIHNQVSRQIAIVLTDKVTALNMTVFEIIALGRYPYLDWNIRLGQHDMAIIEQAIGSVNIAHLTGHKLHTLSDGQLQMVMIARALAQDTPIILLDEPTAHLDLNNRVEIMKLLRTLARTMNKSILVATHELDLALQLADGIWLTGRDKSILTGIPEDLVLNGAFDTIFRFKGFDLKTGKVQHETYADIMVHLTGSGPEYLWTKNALERNGLEVTDRESPLAVRILKQNDVLLWQLTKTGIEKKVPSLAELIELILS